MGVRIIILLEVPTGVDTVSIGATGVDGIIGTVVRGKVVRLVTGVEAAGVDY
jgi:hypothetical protein